MIDKDPELGIKRGYLKRDFEFFHIKDQRRIEIEPHYHDFNKIVIFISGNVTYVIEGKAYRLKPFDILFVNEGDVHRPIIDSSEAYERIILWVNSKFLEEHNYEDSNLLSCFETSSRRKLSLLRPSPHETAWIRTILSQLEEGVRDQGFASKVLKNALFLQLIVKLNRLFMGNEIVSPDVDIQYDEKIEKILEFINQNLEGDLSIDRLSSELFISKYYLMHRFKSQTGYTIHSYILQKRLIKASGLIRSGRQIGEVCVECGFNDYSSFVRAFKNHFGVSPREYFKMGE